MEHELDLITLKEYVEEQNVFVAAHRGASGPFPENTMIAYEEALKAGAKMIEVDVQMTVDKKIICFHDSHLGRTVRGRKKISRLPLKVVKKFDAGSWYDTYFRNEKVPTLEEAIELIKGKAYLNIEIKSRKKEFNKERARRVYEIVKKMDYLDYTLFGSFDYKLLQIMKEHDENIHTAAIKIPTKTELPSEIKARISCDAFVCSIDEITEEIDKDCQENGIYLGLYSVDNWYEMEKIKKFKVKTIVSNFPATAVPLINKYFPRRVEI